MCLSLGEKRIKGKEIKDWQCKRIATTTTTTTMTTTTTLRLAWRWTTMKNMKQDNNFTLLKRFFFLVTKNIRAVCILLLSASLSLLLLLFLTGHVFASFTCHFSFRTIFSVVYEICWWLSEQSSKILCNLFSSFILFMSVCGGLARIVCIARSICFNVWIMYTRHRTWWEWHLWGIFARCAIYLLILSRSRTRSRSGSHSLFHFPTPPISFTFHSRRV